MSSSRDAPQFTVDLINLSDPASPTAAAPARSMLASVDVWRDTLLPDWTDKRSDPVIRTRILQGVPPEVQGELWFIGIALPAEYDDALYEACVERAAALRERVVADATGQFRCAHSRVVGDLLTIEADVPRTLVGARADAFSRAGAAAAAEGDTHAAVDGGGDGDVRASELYLALDPLVAELVGCDEPLEQALRRMVRQSLQMAGEAERPSEAIGYVQVRACVRCGACAL
eukprot:6380518-Prymnesium_polylepis.1